MKKRNPYADVHGARLRKRGTKKTRDYEIRMMKAGEPNNFVERAMKREAIRSYGLKLRKRDVVEPYGVRIMKRNTPTSRLLYSLPGKVMRWGKRESLPDGADFGEIWFGPMGKTMNTIMKSSKDGRRKKSMKESEKNVLNMRPYGAGTLTRNFSGKRSEKKVREDMKTAKRSYDGIRMMKKDYDGIRMMKRELPLPRLRNYWTWT